MNLKRFWATILSALLLLSLAACGNGQQLPETDDSSQTIDSEQSKTENEPQSETPESEEVHPVDCLLYTSNDGYLNGFRCR